MRLREATRAVGIRCLVPIALVAASCAGLGCRSTGRAARPVGGPGPGVTQLQGVIGNRPFVARSAFMMPPTRWDNGTTTQELYIFERPMTCADADAIDRITREIIPGEHVITVELSAPWPAYPGSVWSSVPMSPGGNADMRLVRRGSNGAPSGDAARGEMRVLWASRGAGTVSLQVAADPSDPAFQNISQQSVAMKLWGSARGEVSFTVCER
jgi:hypothetical protein